MPVIDCKQRSEEWFSIRAGKVTASEVANVLSVLTRKSKNGEVGDETAARAKYKARIAAETLSGAPILDQKFKSDEMEWGTENEPFAIGAYEARNGVSVIPVGFVTHPTIERAGASPDGFVGVDGGVEVKCPKTETHLAYMRAGIVPPEYEPQIMFNLACSEREWWDFVSFDGRWPRRHQLFQRRMFRDEKRIKEIEEAVIQFLAEADAVIAELERLNPEVEEPIIAKFIQPDDEALVTDEDIEDWYRSTGAQR